MPAGDPAVRSRQRPGQARLTRPGRPKVRGPARQLGRLTAWGNPGAAATGRYPTMGPMPTPSIEASYRRRWPVLAVLCLSVLLVVVSNMALNVALPALRRDLHAGVSSLAWVVDTYVLCFAGLLLPAGAAGDRLGRKGVLQCGLVLFTI